MFKILAQIESKLGEHQAYLHMDPNMPVEIAEQLVVQYLQYFGKLKEQQVKSQPPQEDSVPQESSQPKEEPKPME